MLFENNIFDKPGVLTPQGSNYISGPVGAKF
jgi:hypothetical protein